MTFVSLGSTCAVANYLNSINKRNSSYPFDWCKINIKQLIKVLSNDFIDYNNIIIDKYSDNHPYINDNTIGSLIIKNTYNIKFAHEVLYNAEINEFIKKIDKRIIRFKNLTDPIFIRYEEEKFKKTYNENLNELISLLNKYFKNYKLILVLPRTYKINTNYHNVIIYYYDNYTDWKNINAFSQINL